MRTITLCQRKGGTAKTTSGLNLGAGLIRKGKRILFIDLDAQSNLTATLRVNPEYLERSAYEILTGKARAEQTIVRTNEGDLIPASPDLALIDKENTRRWNRLQDALKPLGERYDYCIIDTPPALGTSLINALTASQSAIIVAEPQQSSRDGLKALMETINAVRKSTNPDLTIEGILITRANIRTIITKDMIQNFKEDAEHFHTKVFNTVIRETTSIKEAEAMRQSVIQYAPRSNGAKDYMDLTEEILTEEE